MKFSSVALFLVMLATLAAQPKPVLAQGSASLSASRAVAGALPRLEERDARYFGHSGALRAVIVPATEELPASLLSAVNAAGHEAVRWQPLLARGDGLVGEPVRNGADLFAGATLGSPAGDELLGDPIARGGIRAPEAPGLWTLVPAEKPEEAASEPDERDEPALAVITRLPFEHKAGSVLNGYRIGRYVTEGSGRTDIYAPPPGFVEVTRENQNFFISENFQLRQFLTKNQKDVWPKYLALDLRLVDKLELVLQELNAMGIRADRMHVMSGFRTPEYNGPGSGGRAQLSRHTYGDAADVWVDTDGNGYMDDLNGDGVVDIRDAQVMLRAVARVEAKFPELVGGAGVYVATGAHGPFIHIDVRGTPARW